MLFVSLAHNAHHAAFFHIPRIPRCCKLIAVQHCSKGTGLSSLPSPYGEVPSGMLSGCAAHGGDKRPSQAALLSRVGHKSELSSGSPQVAVSQRARRRTECQVGPQRSPAVAHTQIHTSSSFHRTHLEALQPRERATQCGGRRP